MADCGKNCGECNESENIKYIRDKVDAILTVSTRNEEKIKGLDKGQGRLWWVAGILATAIGSLAGWHVLTKGV